MASRFRDQKVILTAIIFPLLVFLLLFIALLWGTLEELSKEDDLNLERSEESYSNHIVVLQDSQDLSEDWQKGILSEARSLGMAFEWIELDKSQNLDSSLKSYLHTGIDGILVINQNTTLDSEILRDFTRLYIPIKALNAQGPYLMSKYLHYQSIGETFANQIEYLSNQIQYVGVLIHANQRTDDPRLNIYRGLSNALSSIPQLQLVESEKGGESGVQAMSALYNMLQRNPSVNVLLCTSAEMSFGAVRYIIDNNLVGDIKIFSIGDSEEIRGYIRKKLIAGTLVINYEDAGMQSIASLSKQMNSQETVGFVPQFSWLELGSNGFLKEEFIVF